MPPNKVFNSPVMISFHIFQHIKARTSLDTLTCGKPPAQSDELLPETISSRAPEDHQTDLFMQTHAGFQVPSLDFQVGSFRNSSPASAVFVYLLNQATNCARPSRATAARNTIHSKVNCRRRSMVMEARANPARVSRLTRAR